MANVLEETQKGMRKRVDHLQEEFQNLRTNRPNPGMLDRVKVNAYGTEMQLRQLATVTVEGRRLVVTPFDKTLASFIRAGIEAAHLKVNPVLEGGVVYVPLPEMSEEMRKEIAAEARARLERAKVSIREWRGKAKELLKKQLVEGEMGEDEGKKQEKRVQDFTDQFCKEAEEMAQRKIKEIMGG